MSVAFKIGEPILSEDIELKRGQEVLFIGDYQVWGHNVKGMSGILVREKTSFDKCVVYIPKIKKWCEPTMNLIKVFNDAVIPENEEFLARIKEFKYTLPTNRRIK